VSKRKKRRLASTAAAKGDRTEVPYGPSQPAADTAPAARRSGTGRTLVKVGVGLALPFVARAIFRALAK